MEEPDELTSAEETSLPVYTRRRQLLPWWIKIFTWIFMIMGVAAVIGIFISIIGVKFQLALFGFETSEPLSFTGILLMVLFIIKGVSSYALWTEKSWALRLAEIDALIGIIVCIFFMLIYPFISIRSGFKLQLRLELVLLIPYLIKLRRMKEDWGKTPAGS